MYINVKYYLWNRYFCLNNKYYLEPCQVGVKEMLEDKLILPSTQVCLVLCKVPAKQRGTRPDRGSIDALR